jgi:hypothetical protein
MNYFVLIEAILWCSKDGQLLILSLVVNISVTKNAVIIHNTMFTDKYIAQKLVFMVLWESTVVSFNYTLYHMHLHFCRIYTYYRNNSIFGYALSIKTIHVCFIIFWTLPCIYSLCQITEFVLIKLTRMML